VSFDDFALEPSNTEMCDAQESWSGAALATFAKAYRAPVECAVLLHREMIDIAQRNVNASFGFLRRLAGAKNLGEMLDLQVTYWRSQSAALIGQAEELGAMVTNSGADMTGLFNAHVPSSIHDMRKALVK